MSLSEIADIAIFIIQCLGVAAFALSGTVAAMRKRADVFGVLVLAVTTAFGGGLIRDILIGKIPPSLFADADCKIFFLLTIAVSAGCMALCSFRPAARALLRHSDGQILNAADALGLSVFCVIGVDAGLSQGYTSVFLLTALGGITGVGGGVLRDVFVGEIPMVFKKHVYALPTVLGSLGYVLLLRVAPQLIAMVAAILFITAVRVLASVFRWNLPVPYCRIDDIDRAETEEKRRREEELKERRAEKHKAK